MEASKLKNIYIVILIFTSFKGFGVLVPDIAATLTATFTPARFDGCGSSNVSTEKNDEPNLAHQWIDLLVLLHIIAWELLPLELIMMRKSPIKFKYICIWAAVHLFLSSLYVTNRMMMAKKIKDLMCMIDIFLQVISLSLVFTIFWWSRAMLVKRIEETRWEAEYRTWTG
ncbi:unnamed protein product [Orchesella dallaii]|uniref:Transmembrane protein n=1 Tax=Orchesella dallaii TaxID=48710 RepID=A0ABP1RV96_9HEXA